LFFLFVEGTLRQAKAARAAATTDWYRSWEELAI
jgi:hypothetical protein